MCIPHCVRLTVGKFALRRDHFLSYGRTSGEAVARRSQNPADLNVDDAGPAGLVTAEACELIAMHASS